MKRNTTKVLSLFTGIGGMDMGFGGQVVVHKDSVVEDFVESTYTTKDFVRLKPHDFDIVFQNDILTGAKEVCELNKTASSYNTESIFDLLSEDYEFPKADVVIGGFPCQDFSHCGKRAGFKSTKSHNLKDSVNDDRNNSRGTLYKSFVNVVKRVKPKVFVAENVYGLLTMKGNPIEQIVKDFSDLGYEVKYQLIDCTKFGIPQTRKRVIIIGILCQDKVLLETLPEDWNLITKNQTQCNVGKYFEHLDEPSTTADISQQLFSKAKRLTKGQGQVELNMGGFSPTIRAEHHGNIEFRRHANSTVNVNESHLDERRLTVREAGLIQTFPPDYIFTEKKTMKSYKYIGNAVPPLLGYLIADKVNYIIKSLLVER